MSILKSVNNKIKEKAFQKYIESKVYFHILY